MELPFKDSNSIFNVFKSLYNILPDHFSSQLLTIFLFPSSNLYFYAIYSFCLFPSIQRFVNGNAEHLVTEIG